MGAEPHRWAKADSLCRRWGLSPAETSSAPTVFGAEPVAGDEVGGGGPHERGEDGVEGLDLFLEGLDPPGQLPQRELGGADGRRWGLRAEAGPRL